jgi:hypothetical protein
VPGINGLTLSCNFKAFNIQQYPPVFPKPKKTKNTRLLTAYTLNGYIQKLLTGGYIGGKAHKIVSTGLYNWQNDVGFVLAFIATVTTALLSYHFFEKPFLRLKTKFTFVPSRD